MVSYFFQLQIIVTHSLFALRGNVAITLGVENM